MNTKQAVLDNNRKYIRKHYGVDIQKYYITACWNQNLTQEQLDMTGKALQAMLVNYHYIKEPAMYMVYIVDTLRHNYGLEVLDHVSYWKNKNGKPVIVSQPYFDSQMCKNFLNIMNKYGAEVEFYPSTMSWYYPYKTVFWIVKDLRTLYNKLKPGA